ncbi:MAG: diacylglycerol kinase [Myxococcales bacterium]|nr:diacylglycerol kinase [Myxococcales bacterium]
MGRGHNVISAGATDHVRRRAAAPRIGLIINVRARANQHHPDRLRVLARMIGRHDQLATTRSIEELEQACAQLASDRPEIVAICGGDGTLHQTLTALIRSYGDRPLPAIAILRGGAMNIVATSLGIHGHPVDHLRALVELKRRGGLASLPASSRFAHPLLQIGDRYGFMFGAGVIHDFLEAYYATGRPSPLTAARLLLRAAASTLVGGPLSKQLCQPVHAHVVTDGRVWPRDQFAALCAATIEQIGLGFRPFYRCREDAERFSVLGIDTSPLGLLRELPRVRAGKPMHPSKVIDEIAREVTIASADHRALGYMIDGDLYACDGALTILRGPVLELVRLGSPHG